MCQTKCERRAVIYQNYYFHHNRRYKDGNYWCCAQRKCRVRLVSDKDDNFSRRNNAIQHDHPPNAPNLVEREFRSHLRYHLNSEPNASIRQVYDYVKGLFENDKSIPSDLVPAFWSVRSSMYRVRTEQTLLSSPPRISPIADAQEVQHYPRSNEVNPEPLDYSLYADPIQLPEPESINNYDYAPQEEPLSLVKLKVSDSPRPSSPINKLRQIDFSNEAPTYYSYYPPIPPYNAESNVPRFWGDYYNMIFLQHQQHMAGMRF